MKDYSRDREAAMRQSALDPASAVWPSHPTRQLFREIGFALGQIGFLVPGRAIEKLNKIGFDL
jgi:hypothetical protein